ncbi:hypothetical protein, partial [Microvirga arabica]|uniref:hypothetical protein n=1 Tax=Microvirga arabica TaxID=1128671 RepID=UPI001AEE3D8B
MSKAGYPTGRKNGITPQPLLSHERKWRQGGDLSLEPHPVIQRSCQPLPDDAVTECLAAFVDAELQVVRQRVDVGLR